LDIPSKAFNYLRSPLTRFVTNIWGRRGVERESLQYFCKNRLKTIRIIPTY
jgi:hypothetical protein